MTEQTRALGDLADRFARREWAPAALEADRWPFADFPRLVYERAAALGLLTPLAPEAYGGPGLGFEDLAVILRHTARVDASAAVMILVQTLVRAALLEFGSEALSRTWVPWANETPFSFLAWPLYDDPEDPPETLTVRSRGDGFVLSGVARSLAGGIEDGGNRTGAAVIGVHEHGAGLFWVDESQAGVRWGDPVIGLGLRACPVRDAYFSAAAVPADRVLIRPGGLKNLAQWLDPFRLMAAYTALGVLEGAYWTARDYARRRRQGGRTIIQYDMIRGKLARMAAWIDLAGSALSNAAAAMEAGRPGDSASFLSLQTLVGAETARLTGEAVQVLGGVGYCHDFGQEKRMRDARRLESLFGGASGRWITLADRCLGRGDEGGEPVASTGGEC
jgi:alkylation response protein AidB-like acyl-CoA dehydrogenase